MKMLGRTVFARFFRVREPCERKLTRGIKTELFEFLFFLVRGEEGGAEVFM